MSLGQIFQSGMGQCLGAKAGWAKFGLSAALVGIVGGAFSLAGSAPERSRSQDGDLPPPRGAIQPPQEGRVPLEQRPNAIGRLRGQLPDMLQMRQQFQQRMGGNGGMSYSRSVANGVTTILVTEQDQETKIEETPDGIFMEIGRTYTRDDLESLRSSHPELAKAIESFPARADGQEVQLSVRAVTKYEAINEEDLKEEHPQAYEHYKRLSQMGGRSGLSDVFGGGILDFEQGFGRPLDAFGDGGLLEEAEAMMKRQEQRLEQLRKRLNPDR